MFVILIISLITRLFFFSETILLEKKNTVVQLNDCKIFASGILRHVPFFYV